MSLKLNADLEALKGLYEYDSSFEAGKGYPLNQASSKVGLNNSVLRLSRFYKFKQFFARRQTCYHDTSVYYEVTSLIQRHGGNVLKYVGIAVIAFFTLSSKQDHCLH